MVIGDAKRTLVSWRGPADVRAEDDQGAQDVAVAFDRLGIEGVIGFNGRGAGRRVSRGL